MHVRTESFSSTHSCKKCNSEANPQLLKSTLIHAQYAPIGRIHAVMFLTINGDSARG